MSLLSRLSYDQNWNIGFCDQSIEELLENKKLAPIQWMKHNYSDRWFADPFIYEVNDKIIIIFAEEYRFHTHKGIICELHVDRKTKQLIRSYELLSLDTHLSYPAIINKDGKVYVYPENGQAGYLCVYEYDGANHKLINRQKLVEEALADSTICNFNNRYYLIATKYPHTQQNAYMYVSDDIFGQYQSILNKPIFENLISRPGGNWIIRNNLLYCPVQDCSIRYGGGLNIMSVVLNDNSYKVSKVFSLYPKSWKYNLGLHTINGVGNTIAIDGYGYTYPLLGRIIDCMRHIVKTLKKF